VRTDRLALAVTCALLLAASCTRGQPSQGTASGRASGSPGASSTAAAPQVRGTVLLTIGTQGRELALLDLASGRTRALRMPGSSNFYFEQAFLDAAGTPYILQLGPTIQVLALSHDRRPQPVGPRLDACVLSSEFVGDIVYARDCQGGRLHALDLTQPSGWTTVSSGLKGLLGPAFVHSLEGIGSLLGLAVSNSTPVSPDGRRMAFLLKRPGGLELWEATIDGSAPPRRLLAIDQLEALRAAGMAGARLFSGVVWGSAGIAVGLATNTSGFGFGSTSLGAIVVRTTGGRVQVVPMGNLAPEAMAWQPGGHMLAFVDDIGQGGFFQSRYQELRTIDVATGEVRQLATSSGVFNGAVAWSPNGDAVAWSHAAGLLQLFTPSGATIADVRAEGVPDAWVR